MYFTFRSPAVQTYLANKAAEYLSRELDAKVSVGGVNITYTMNIVLEDLALEDQRGEPLLATQKIEFDISHISFSNRTLNINKLLFDQALLYITEYEDENLHNFQFILDYFQADKQDTDTITLPNWDVSVRSFEFAQSGLWYKNHNQQDSDFGFNQSNFVVDNFYIDIEDIFFEDEIFMASLVNLSLGESNGFSLNKVTADIFLSPLGGHINNFELNTALSQVKMDVALDYNSYNSFRHFADSVDFDIELQASDLDLYEIGYFIPQAYGIEGLTRVEGNFSGQLSNLQASDVYMRYGNMTQFTGDFDITGLPDKENAFMNFSVDHLITHKKDIEQFRLPGEKTAYLELPPEFESLGVTSFRGNFTGFLHDFAASGNIQSALGEISADLAITSSDNFENVVYEGNLATNEFRLGLFTGNTSWGRITFDTHISGSGLTLEDADMDMTGRVKSMVFNKYEYRNIDVNGRFYNKRFNGNLLIDDPNLLVNFNGLVDFHEDIPLLNFTLELERANLTQLNLYQRDSLFHSLVSTVVHVDGKGSNLDNMEGDVIAYQSSYYEKAIEPSDTIIEQAYHTDVIALENHNLPNDHKLVRFYSDFADFRMEGNINFENIVQSFQQMAYTYAPARFRNPPPENNNGERYIQTANFEIHLKNTEPITAIFWPAIRIAPHTFLNGNIDTQNSSIALNGDIDYISLGNRNIQNLSLKLHSDTTELLLTTQSDRFLLSDSIWMDRFTFSGKVASDSITVTSEWENHQSRNKNYGQVNAKGNFISPNFTQFSIMPSRAYINDSLWTIRPGNQITLDSTSIAIENFFLYKNDEDLKVDGVLSDSPEDQLLLELNNFDLKSFAFLLGDRKLDFAGFASGKVNLSTLNHSPSITANMLVKDFAFNHDHLGDLSVESNWDANENAFKVGAEVIYYGNVGYNKPIIVNGYFYPEREDDNFDLDIKIENLKMSVFGRYMESFTSNFRGLASGNLRLDGPVEQPELTGRARLVRTGFRVDYLNTSYSFAHEVEVGKDYFKLDNLTLNDTIGNTANVSGVIRHTNFNNFSLDLSIWPDRMVVLNTMPHHNNSFYGTAFATGLARIHGPVNDITLDISALTNRGTRISLPLDYDGLMTESSFITFVAPQDKANGNQQIEIPQTQIQGLTMNFDLEITPDAEVQIIFDSQIGDIMRGRGFGDLKFELDNQGGFNIYGDYTLEDGDYLFTLQNLINKRFRMEQGGTISWRGDPYNAEIDIRTIYSLRTTLHDLAMNQADTADIYQRRVPVETVLHLTENLSNPSINFEIQLPSADESAREMLDRLITTEQEMNRQVFSLLILNRFVPPDDSFNTALGYGMGSTSTELLSNQLSNWLSQISSDFDIGVNYRPGDEISSQEIEVALSTQLFDDRVIIDGNVGVAGDHPAQTQRASNIIGDVNVEVKITPEGKFRVKAFNRSNTFDIINTNAPYTQGVGVFYRREFDSLSDLFRKQKRSSLDIPEVQTVQEDFESTDISPLTPGE